MHNNKFIFNGKVFSLFHLAGVWIDGRTRVVVFIGGKEFYEDFSTPVEAEKRFEEIIEF